MEEQNPYRNPTRQVADVIADGDSLALADRGTRLGAAILDGLLMLAINLPVMWFGGYLSTVMAASQAGLRPPFGLMLLWTLIGFVLFLLVQGMPLNQTGQTWGKRLLKIRIVDLNGDKPAFARLIALRYLPVSLASLVPIIGPLFGIIDALFIFRADRRCLHDLIAGTRVVNAR
ncbi:putative RDD family membrane protein YckC [Tahibacter aquaticus]|uniref:Putative RDD family membrane protein YckC n=1 Tax=Tahibacter aquaticus TaxID=520092 RepID=A0A4R6Z7E9_9GAMM|nr:RDD family protein [Tahibacter aquaticus]TDR47723.1 putative RDD family membrane protein YckC [Tahibacter aquaticus]